jgi:small subunit ribosomal protein S19e
LATVYDVEANSLIESAAKELAKSKNVKAPEWAAFVKTGMAKDRIPSRSDWWYVRSAAILRSIYQSNGPIGTQKLRTKYGSKKNRGHKPEQVYRASGKIIRLILQQLEKEGYLKQADKEGHKGRIITGPGKSFLDKIASGLAKARPAPKKEAKEEKKEAPKEIDIPDVE